MVLTLVRVVVARAFLAKVPVRERCTNLNSCPVSATLKPFMVKRHLMDMVEASWQEKQRAGVGYKGLFSGIVPHLHF